jgi:hypothetical protein
MDDKIILGGKDYPVAPLSLGAMRQAGPCFTRIGIDTTEGMSAQLTIIFHGMKAANAGLKMEDVDALQGVTFAEIRAAVQKIGELCGLEVKEVVKDAPVGEVQPAAGPA